MNRGKLISKIQTIRRGKAELAEDDVWRGFLQKTTGKDSLRAMSDAELGKVADTLGGQRSSLSGKRSGGRGMITPAQHQKLYQLARARGWDGLKDGRCTAFLERTAGVSEVRFLTNRDASACITGLEKWLEGSASQ